MVPLGVSAPGKIASSWVIARKSARKEIGRLCAFCSRLWLALETGLPVAAALAGLLATGDPR
jgi:hypothetical protein